MTRRRRLPRSPLVGAGLAFVLGASACGFGADAGTPTADAASGARTTTARTTVPRTVAVGDSVAASELAARSAGALREAGTVRLTVTTAGRSLAGELDVRGSSPAYRIAGGTGADAVEVRWVDGVGYLAGEQFRAVAGGRSYLRVRPGGTDRMSRLLAPLLATLQRAADPSSLVSGFGAVRATVVEVEGGRATWSLKVTAAQLRAATERLLGQPLPAQAVSRLRPMTFEQTLDEAGRLVSARQLGGADADATVTYSGYGADVRIAAPAAGDVGTAGG